jgi:2-amino-4-hydroxy-6-hydroxymethyldihydropteridine diphosphokinase
MAEILLSLGANLGDPVRTLSLALDRLDQAGVRITARSRLYRTPPWGLVDQPAFVNLCARAETVLAPRRLLEVVHAIEKGLGRERHIPWGPRLVDIDILTYGELSIEEPGLTIPHPAMTARAFVLVPLCDIAPDQVVAGRRVAEWAGLVDSAGIEAIEPDAPAAVRTST